MAAAVELREPLSVLYPENSQDLGRRLRVPTKASLQKKSVRKSASLGASRTAFVPKAEPLVSPSRCTERLVRRRSTKKNRSPEPMVEDRLPAGNSLPTVELPEPVSHAESDVIGKGAAKEEGGESESLMQMKLEAMTWAAMAKDDTIASLEKRLRAALEIAKAEQERNQEREGLLREKKERLGATAQELQDAREQIEQLIEAEERLCVQLGNLEVEAVGEDRRYRSEISILTERMETQDRFIADALSPSKAAQSQVIQQSDVSKTQLREYQSLSEKLELAKKEIASLQADLSCANTDLRVFNNLKRNKSRRLKALEKERRRHMTRKGVIRASRSAPRVHKKTETEAPGGAGWKVFSILDFQA